MERRLATGITEFRMSEQIQRKLIYPNSFRLRPKGVCTHAL